MRRQAVLQGQASLWQSAASDMADCAVQQKDYGRDKRCIPERERGSNLRTPSASVILSAHGLMEPCVPAVPSCGLTRAQNDAHLGGAGGGGAGREEGAGDWQARARSRSSLLFVQADRRRSPILHREAHIGALLKGIERLSSNMSSLDASRPWYIASRSCVTSLTQV